MEKTATEKAREKKQILQLKLEMKKLKQDAKKVVKTEKAKARNAKMKKIFRLFFALFCWIVSSYLLTFGIFSVFGGSVLIKTIVFVGILLIVIGITLGIFTFDIPQYFAYNLFNYFTGKLTTYMPGFHFRYPWDLIREESQHSLKSIKENLKENYPAGDGVVLIAKFMFQYRPDPKMLTTFEGVDNAVINAALVDEASSVLVKYIAKPDKTAKGIRTEIDVLQEHVRKIFGVEERGTLPQIGDYYTQRDIKPIEKAYGIMLEVASLNDLDFEPDYQKVLTARKAMDEIQEMANKIFIDNDGQIDKKEAWDQAMIVAGKTVGNLVKTTGGGGGTIPMLNIGKGGST